MQEPALIRPPRRLLSQDRRDRKRYVGLPILCQVLASASPPREADVVDLSPHGACLALPGAVEAGSVLRLRLSNRPQLCSHEVGLRVSHCHERIDRPWLVGGAFVDPLPPGVWLALLE